ncbi:MAG: tRNA pseudouridine(38-40) synthase TruA [Bdellovibrionota bacterium]
MNYYKAIIQYDGSDRMGFQWQEGKPTIQGDLELTLQKILQGEVTTRAASRTDKGVHAIGQVLKISAEDSSPLFIERINTELPSHIRCLDLTPCAREFIPSIDQTSKEYRYLFSNLPDQRYIAHAPENMNIANIKTCVELLKGINDFRNFWSIGGIANTTIREILDCDLTIVNPQDLFKNTLFTAGQIDCCWQFRIVGKGFLKHMVRHLVGALWQVGNGRLSVQDFSNLLYGEQKEARPWKKADPRGLYLLKVNYEPG